MVKQKFNSRILTKIIEIGLMELIIDYARVTPQPSLVEFATPTSSKGLVRDCGKRCSRTSAAGSMFKSSLSVLSSIAEKFRSIASPALAARRAIRLKEYSGPGTSRMLSCKVDKAAYLADTSLIEMSGFEIPAASLAGEIAN